MLKPGQSQSDGNRHEKKRDYLYRQRPTAFAREHQECIGQYQRQKGEGVVVSVGIPPSHSSYDPARKLSSRLRYRATVSISRLTSDPWASSPSVVTSLVCGIR